MKKFIKNIPVIGPIAKLAYHAIHPPTSFPGSEKYWSERYKQGGNSGDGSYGLLAEFKAEVINQFVHDNGIKSVIEFGCGDGNQLKLGKYPSYIGFDVSSESVHLCRQMFSSDSTKKFFLMKDYAGQEAELTMSLDVIYHLIEDDVFNLYMTRLFNSSSRFLIIYSSNEEGEMNSHERPRKFTDWITKNRPDWIILNHIPNKYPPNGDTKTGSSADFFIFEKAQQQR